MNEEKMNNLLQLVENGVNLNTILPRIQGLEREMEQLRIERDREQRVTVNSEQVRDAAQEAARFLLHFRDQMSTAPIIEQKTLLRQVVRGILVDRERDTIYCTLTRLPQMQNKLLASLHDQQSPSLEECARSRT
mgnify:CR=1 FL=1